MEAGASLTSQLFLFSFSISSAIHFLGIPESNWKIGQIETTPFYQVKVI